MPLFKYFFDLNMVVQFDWATTIFIVLIKECRIPFGFKPQKEHGKGKTLANLRIKILNKSEDEMNLLPKSSILFLTVLLHSSLG